MKKLLLILICLLVSFEVRSEPKTILKLFCKYDPNLIRKNQFSNGKIFDEVITDTYETCLRFGCEETIEVKEKNPNSKSFSYYKWGNSKYSFDNALIEDRELVLLENFKMEEDSISIKTFIFYLNYYESYKINRITGTVRRSLHNYNKDLWEHYINPLDRDSERYKRLNKMFLNTSNEISSNEFGDYGIFSNRLFFEGKCEKAKKKLF